MASVANLGVAGWAALASASLPPKPARFGLRGGPLRKNDVKRGAG